MSLFTGVIATARGIWTVHRKTGRIRFLMWSEYLGTDRTDLDMRWHCYMSREMAEAKHQELSKKTEGKN